MDEKSGLSPDVCGKKTNDTAEYRSLNTKLSWATVEVKLNTKLLFGTWATVEVKLNAKLSWATVEVKLLSCRGEAGFNF